MFDTLNNLLLPISIWFQQADPWLITIMKGFTFLGNVEFYLLIMPALYWSIQPKLGIRLAVILLISGAVNSILKLTFQTPRPYWISERVIGHTAENSYGFPSGHAQNAAGIWGLLAAAAQTPILKFLAAAIILLIGLSRIILGVHFVHDVFFGWLVGGLLLGGYLRVEQPLISWIQKLSPAMKVQGLVLFCMGGILLTGLIFQPLSPPEIPAGWKPGLGASPSPYNFDNLLTTLGALMGLGIGLTFLDRRFIFLGEGSLKERLLRYPVGLIGVVLLWAGLDQIFPDQLTWASLSFRFLRYTLIGLWISYGAPQMFSRLGIASLQPRDNLT